MTKATMYSVASCHVSIGQAGYSHCMGYYSQSTSPPPPHLTPAHSVEFLSKQSPYTIIPALQGLRTSQMIRVTRSLDLFNVHISLLVTRALTNISARFNLFTTYNLQFTRRQSEDRQIPILNTRTAEMGKFTLIDS